MLAWPAIGLVLLLVLALIAGIAAYPRLRGRRWTWFRTIGIAIAAAAVLLGDELLGRIYLEHVCEAEHGVKTFKTAYLPSEYWDEKGEPRFVRPLGNIDMKALDDKFDWKATSEPVLTFGAHVDRVTSRLVNKANDETLAEKITFSRRYGWVHRATSLAPNVGESCADVIAQRHGREEMVRRDREDYAALVRNVFLRSTTR